MSSGERSVRYPAKAQTLEALKQVVDDCPPWACSKFAVEFQGKMLDYGAAANLVQRDDSRQRR